MPGREEQREWRCVGPAPTLPLHTTAGCKSASPVTSSECLAFGPDICSQMCLRCLLCGLQNLAAGAQGDPGLLGLPGWSFLAVLEASRGQRPAQGLAYSRCSLWQGVALTADYLVRGMAAARWPGFRSGL